MSSKAENKQSRLTIASVPKDPEERVEMVLRAYEAITGKKATPEEIAEIRADAGLPAEKPAND